MISRNAEDYLECIYDLTKGNSPAKTNEIASRMGVSPASVTEMVQKLAAEGHLDYRKYKGATLTPKGMRVAKKMKRRHRLLERFLVDVLGIKKDKGGEEACRLEHIVSDESMKKICQLMNDPSICPDGRPYPECEEECEFIKEGGKSTLQDLEEGEMGRITHLSCEHPGRIRRLISMGFVPGRTIEMEESIPLGGPLLLKLENNRVALAREYARLVHVRRCT